MQIFYSSTSVSSWRDGANKQATRFQQREGQIRAVERERLKSFSPDDDADKPSEVGQREDSVGSASASWSHHV